MTWSQAFSLSFESHLLYGRGGSAWGLGSDGTTDMLKFLGFSFPSKYFVSL